MSFVIAILFALVILVAVYGTNVTSGKMKAIPILLGLGLVLFFAIFFQTRWFVVWGGVLAVAGHFFLKAHRLVWKIVLGVLVLLIIVGGVILTSPLIRLKPTSAPCQPAPNWDLTTGGEVTNNLDDGDGVMGTIMMITRDNPSKEPVLFVILPGSSLDIEYQGKMYFTTDRYNGSLAEAVCLADSLHKGIKDKIVIGATEALPTGWKKLEAVDGWWTASTWLYQETPIQPTGLTASEGIFVSTEQSIRDIVTKEGEVVYGQFWQPGSVGSVVHIQVRPNESLTIPQGWEGTYWVWTGDFKVGELELQKRMLQATFTEVVNRDEISHVSLLVCGDLPSELDAVYTLYTGPKFGDIVWSPNLDGWNCKAK